MFGNSSIQEGQIISCSQIFEYGIHDIDKEQFMRKNPDIGRMATGTTHLLIQIKEDKCVGQRTEKIYIVAYVINETSMGTDIQIKKEIFEKDIQDFSMIEILRMIPGGNSFCSPKYTIDRLVKQYVFVDKEFQKYLPETIKNWNKFSEMIDWIA
ncbi:hypothetical protein M0R19_07965 [Candidatus Pacearchaeota archaeon]|jgi:hypothetical protein|nr:hypothetical protein [bacterium]MCK9597093.1 hypothetical protein [Candidatus Pacearchaeota archaeon]